MSFEGLSPELMLCVRIRRERLWCSRPASKRSRQVFRRLLDQTAWDPNLGSRRVLRPILPRTEVSERQPPFRQDARTQIDRPSRDVRTHRAKENTCDHFAGGEGQFITSKGASKRKTRHKPDPPKPKGPHQLWSHRRKPDHYKDPRPGGGPPPARTHHYQPPQLKPVPQPQD